MRRAVFTIIAKNYLAHARTLMESVRRYDPLTERFVVLVDESEDLFVAELEPFRVIRSMDLPIPSVRWFHFKYTVLELSTAVKPYAAQALFDGYGVDQLIYLDPDICVYHSLDEIFRRFEDGDILLTPHLTSPLDDGCRPDELDILRSGSFNLGFIGLQRSDATFALLDWWRQRLYERCVVSPEQGLFVDQRWIDLAPGLFPGVAIIRDPGWNVAYWNVHLRSVEFQDGRPYAGGRPLVFFHFSGFDPLRPETFSRHQNRLTMQELGPAATLAEEYASALLSNGFSECRGWRYTWAFFTDGTPIPDLARPVHHEDPHILSTIEDPFSDAGRERFTSVWNWPVAPSGSARPSLTRLALRVFSVRVDVQQTMPAVYGGDANRYREWFISSGAEEHGLPDCFVAPMQSPPREDYGALETARESEDSEDAAPSSGLLWLDVLILKLPGLQGLLMSRVASSELRNPHTLAAIEKYLGEPDGLNDAAEPLPRIAELILAARADVADACGGREQLDRIRFLTWLLSYGRREYGLPSGISASLRRAWKGRLATLSFKDALVARVRLWGLSLASRRHRNRAPYAPPRGLSALESRIGRNAGHPAARPPAAPAGGSDDLCREFGVNVVGYLHAEMGVGESARLACAALERTSVPFAARAVSTNGVHAERDRRVVESESLPYLFNLVHVNADLFPSAVGEGGAVHLAPRRTIGYWAWELEDFPPVFDDSFRCCREIWTPSEFCRRAIATRSPHPVLVMPHPIRPNIQQVFGRDYFSIDREKFVFVCMADLLSIAARKNPLGAVLAFRKAAMRMPNAELVVKVSNSSRDVGVMNELRAAAAAGQVRLIDRVLTREETDSLIGCADCFVSLHRSEGFGLAMAEAMALGKPVIATGYSGNVDFMDEESAFLVRYGRGEVPPGCEPYRAGSLWAEPDLDHAAEQFVRVYSQRESRESISAKGQALVRRRLDPATVGERMALRLHALRGFVDLS